MALGSPLKSLMRCLDGGLNLPLLLNAAGGLTFKIQVNQYLMRSLVNQSLMRSSRGRIVKTCANMPAAWTQFKGNLNAIQIWTWRWHCTATWTDKFRADMPMEHDPINKTPCWSAYGHQPSRRHCTAMNQTSTVLICLRAKCEPNAIEQRPECDINATRKRLKYELNAGIILLRTWTERWHYTTKNQTTTVLLRLQLSIN